MNIKSTTSGMTGQTGNTVPNYNARLTITSMNTYRGDPNEGYNKGSKHQRTQSTTTETDTDDHLGSKRNNLNGGWIVKGGATATKALAQHVASALDPRGSNGREYP